MTKATKPVTRLTSGLSEHGRELVVTVYNDMISYRVKGHCQRFDLPHEAVYEMACRAYAAANAPKRQRHTVNRGTI